MTLDREPWSVTPSRFSLCSQFLGGESFLRFGVKSAIERGGRWAGRWGVMAALAIALSSVANPNPATANQNVPVLIALMDELWMAREQTGAVQAVIELGSRALKVDPKSYEVMWRVARAHWWVASNEKSREVSKSIAAKGVELAAQAQGLGANRVEGHYIYALSIGEYGTRLGTAKAVWEGIVGKFETAALESYELDRDFDDGGPMIALGRYYYLLPWLKRDLEKSRRYLEELKARHPDRLIGRFYLGQTYYELGEKEKAQRELEFVAQAELPPTTEIGGPSAGHLARAQMREWFPEIVTAMLP